MTTANPEAIAHRYRYHELGRDEDEVVAEVGCECGWYAEVSADKLEVRQEAQRLWDEHLHSAAG